MTLYTWYVGVKVKNQNESNDGVFEVVDRNDILRMRFVGNRCVDGNEHSYSLGLGNFVTN